MKESWKQYNGAIIPIDPPHINVKEKELLNPVKYGLLAEPPQESLDRYATQPSQTDLNPSGPAPAP